MSDTLCGLWLQRMSDIRLSFMGHVCDLHNKTNNGACKSEIKRTISLSHAIWPGLGSKLSFYSLMGVKILNYISNRTRRKYALFHCIFSSLKTIELATSWLTEICDVSILLPLPKKLSLLNSIILPPKNSGFRICCIV